MSEHPRGAGPGRVTTVPAVTTRTFRRGLFAAALLGLAVRAAYILIVRHDVLPGGDAFFYHFGARLLVEGHGVQKRIYFQDGRINFTSSSDPREYLGQFLVSHGYITEDELKKGMEVQEESKILLGRILLMINAI